MNPSWLHEANARYDMAHLTAGFECLPRHKLGGRALLTPQLAFAPYLLLVTDSRPAPPIKKAAPATHLSAGL
jgi:hypothetical protein